MAATKNPADISIAVAQPYLSRGDIKRNVAVHTMMCMAASGSDLVIFPELSLTGYELDIARDHLLNLDDARLETLQAIATRDDTWIVVGAPIPGPRIGALVYSPDPTASFIHTKVHVHPSERHVFKKGLPAPPFSIRDTQVALSICADATHPSHVARAVECGANLYVNSAFVTPDAIDRKRSLLQGYAKRHKIPVVFANYAGDTGGEPSAGCSTIWDEEGQIVIDSVDNLHSLLIAERKEGKWSGKIYRFVP